MLSITIVITTIGKSNNLLKSLNNFLEKSLDEINIELIIIFDINQDSINKSFLKSYGKLRVSGSIAFCLGVFLVGFFLDEFGANSFPKLYIFFSLLFL